MKHSFLFLAFCCYGLFASAQAPTYTGGYSFGGPKDDAFTDVFYHKGQLYYIGTFSDSMDANPGKALSDTFWLRSKGKTDIFISVISESGSFVRAIALGGTGDDFPHAICVDTGGNVYISGRINNSGIDLDPGTGTFLVQGNGLFHFDGYIAHYNTALQFIHAIAIPLRNGATGQHVQLHDMAMGENGDLFVTGAVSGTADLDPGSSEKHLGSGTSGISNLLLVRYNRQLQLIWAYDIGASGNTSGQAIAIDSRNNDILLTGMFAAQKVDMNFGRDSFFLIRSGYAQDLFLARYNTQAQFQWAFRLGNVNDDISTGVVVNPSGRIGISGAYSRTVDFNPAPNDSFKLTAVSDRDAFVALYHPDGRFIAVADTGTTSIDQAYGLAIDRKGYAYYTGQLSGSMFTAKIDSSGKTVWMMRQQGGVNYINGRRVFLDREENLILTSMFTSSFTPVNGGSFNAIPNAGMSDIFVLRYRQAGSSTATTEMPGLVHRLVLAPNPLSGPARLLFNDMQSHAGQWQVFGLDGRVHLSGMVYNSGPELQLDLSNLPQGLYLLEWREAGISPVRIRFQKMP